MLTIIIEIKSRHAKFVTTCCIGELKPISRFRKYTQHSTDLFVGPKFWEAHGPCTMVSFVQLCKGNSSVHRVLYFILTLALVDYSEKVELIPTI